MTTRYEGEAPPIWTRARIVAAARDWIGTPYHHQASLKNVGTDCLGLLRGLWVEIYGSQAERPPAYSPDWAEARGTEELIAGAGRHLLAVAQSDARPGDVIVFRMKPNTPAKHVGLLASETTFIHAMEGVSVSEVQLNSWWRRRIAATFRFPGVLD
jgi:NlpC/P60 family putative phage cell wall peptidase